MNVMITDATGKDRLWPFVSSSSTTIKRLEAAFRASLGLANKLKDQRAAVEATGRFTARGAAEEARRLAREQHLPAIIRGDVALQRARKTVADRMAKLKPTVPDRSDLVGYLNRESIRDELRRMPRERRDNLLTRHAAELDPEIAAAVMEAIELPWTAPQDRLISPETRNALNRRLMPAAELAEIDEIEAAIEYAAPTISQAKTELQAELGINERDFAQLARAETSKTAIWLKRDGARVVVMTPEPGKTTFTSRTATADEIESGVWFTPEAYKAATEAAV